MSVTERFSGYFVPFLKSFHARAQRGEFSKELYEDLGPIFVGMAGLLTFIKNVEARAPGVCERAMADTVAELKTTWLDDTESN